jgi:hypothetical protein
LIGNFRWWDNLVVPIDAAALDPFLKLGDGLRELEVTFGPETRPIIAEIRASLAEAAAMRERGDLPGAVATVGRAMERLAAFGARLDPAEGVLMRMIADRFRTALAGGDKSATKDAINVMRRRAGDPKDDPDNDW